MNTASEKKDDLFKTMNSRIDTSCHSLLSEVESIHTKLRSSWSKTLASGEETKKNRIKTETRKSESRIGNSTKALNLLSDYLSSLEKLKVVHVQSFIESIRSEIGMLWDSCSYGDSQRKVFGGFYSVVYNEELLIEHEEHLRIVKQYYNNNRELFKLVLKREKLWDEKVAFENPADGCSRFENRGGTLIKELKRIQVVEKLLPNTEKQIRLKVKAWEKANKKHFLIKDTQYIKYIDQQKLDYRAEQEMKRQAKRIAKQEEMLLEISHDSVATKRMSVYDNNHNQSKVVGKKFNEESLKELMKPTESSLMKSRLLAKNPDSPGESLSSSRLHLSMISKDIPSSQSKKTPGEGLSSRLHYSMISKNIPGSQMKNSRPIHDEIPSKISKLDLSTSHNNHSLLRKPSSSCIQSKIKSKVITEKDLRELAKPTESFLSKSRFTMKNENNAIKRRSTLLTNAKKRKLKRRSLRIGENNCLNEISDNI